MTSENLLIISLLLILVLLIYWAHLTRLDYLKDLDEYYKIEEQIKNLTHQEEAEDRFRL